GRVTGGVLARRRAAGVLLVGFLGLLVLNAPLAVALGFPALVALQGLGGAHLLMLPQRLIAGVDNFVLLAIPLFLLAGALMETGGVSRRLVALALALVGHFRGGRARRPWEGVWRTSRWWGRSCLGGLRAPRPPMWRSSPRSCSRRWNGRATGAPRPWRL